MHQELSQSSYTPPIFGKKATAFSKEKGQWLLANVDQQIGWPLKLALMIYRECKIIVLPATKFVHAAAAIITKDNGIEEGKILLMQFLSALAWAEQGKISIIEWTSSSTQGTLNKYLRLPLNKRPGVGHQHFGP